MAEEKEMQEGAAAAAEEVSLLDDILKGTGVEVESEFEKEGFKRIIEELVKPGQKDKPLDPKIIDRIVAELDHKLGEQLDQVLGEETLHLHLRHVVEALEVAAPVTRRAGSRRPDQHDTVPRQRHRERRELLQ